MWGVVSGQPIGDTAGVPGALPVSDPDIGNVPVSNRSYILALRSTCFAYESGSTLRKYATVDPKLFASRAVPELWRRWLQLAESRPSQMQSGSP